MKILRTLLILCIICLTNSHSTSGQKVNPYASIVWEESNLVEFGIKLYYPNDWILGNANSTITKWVVVPNFEAKGNIVLKMMPWDFKPIFSSYSSPQFKNDLLPNSLYSDLTFVVYDNKYKVAGQDALFTYLIAKGKFVDELYQEIIFQWWKDGILYTLQGAFGVEMLKKDEIELIQKMADKIKFQ